MRKSKWPDFLFTITVRFVCGVVFGGLACFLFTWRGILRAFSHDSTHWPLIWVGLCGLAGGIVAVLTVPWWQTPWYRRDSEELGILTELGTPGRGRNWAESKGTHKSITIRTVTERGEQHQYSSMEEVPPEVRSQIEALEKEAMQQKGEQLSVAESSQAGNAITSKFIHRKNVTVYKIVDESGVERVYHSLEEMPTEVRAAIEAAGQIDRNERGGA
jgi:hypothetical protein